MTPDLCRKVKKNSKTVKKREETHRRLYGKPPDPPEGGTLDSALKEGNCVSW